MDNIFTDWESCTADRQKATVIKWQRYLDMKASEVELAIRRWEYEQEQDFVDEQC
jgi:hypothetical protein